MAPDPGYPGSILEPSASRGPSTLRVLLTSFWVVYRVMRRAMVQRAGGTLSYLLNITFALGVFLQVAALVYQQEHRIAAQLLQGGGQAVYASGQAAVVF